MILRFAEWPALDLAGFHVYSGSNSFNPMRLPRTSATRSRRSSGLRSGTSFPAAPDRRRRFRHPVFGRSGTAGSRTRRGLVNPLLDRMADPASSDGREPCSRTRADISSVRLDICYTSVVDIKTSRGTLSRYAMPDSTIIWQRMASWDRLSVAIGRLRRSPGRKGLIPGRTRSSAPSVRASTRWRPGWSAAPRTG